MHIAFLFADTQEEWNTSRWRCHILSNSINAQHEKTPEAFPHTARMVQMASALDFNDPGVQSTLGPADLIMFQRNIIFPPVYDAMDYWRALGKIVVSDLDDHYPNIPASNPAFKYWIANTHDMDPDPIEALKIGMREHCDALITPSDVIAKDWEPYVQTYVWPNYAPLQIYKPLKQKQLGAADTVFSYEVKDDIPELVRKPRPDSEGKIVIGWGGSISHVDSFVYSNVIDALIRLMQENKNVLFKFCGHERRLDYLWKRLPEKQFIRQLGVGHEDWPQVIASFDIGIAPLDLRPCEDNLGGHNPGYSYDERRSSLKLVEYLCAGVPWVATDAAPYRDLGYRGKLVENNADAWYEALKARVESLPHFREEAARNRRWALKKLTIESRVEELMKLYTLIGEQAQVTREARLPDTIYVQEEAA